jgi:hypothetical protein
MRRRLSTVALFSCLHSDPCRATFQVGRTLLVSKGKTTNSFRPWRKTRAVGRRDDVGSTFLTLRGGGSPLTVDLTAKLCVGFLAFNGLSILLRPDQVIKYIYQITNCESSDFTTYLLKTLGALSVGTALHIANTLIFKQKVTRAMAVALLPRFAYLMVALVVQPVQGMHRDVLAANASLMGLRTVFSLWTGKGKPILLARIFAVMNAVCAVRFLMNPTAAARWMYGMDVAKPGLEQTRALCRGLGN